MRWIPSEWNPSDDGSRLRPSGSAVWPGPAPPAPACREPRAAEIPCLSKCKKDVLARRRRVAESYGRVQSVRGTPEVGAERARHAAVKRKERSFERSKRMEVINEVCAELT